MHLNTLAIQAGKRRKSALTGFVHHCYGDPGSRETIPLLENFCFALALFRSKTSENILEGKALVERLLAFQSGDNFPVYLHEYPLCRDSQMGQKIYPALFWIDQEFHTILGDSLRNKIAAALALLPRPPITEEPKGEWNATLACYTGPSRQEGLEPEVTLTDLFMGEKSGLFSARALRDHPVHLRAALLRSAVPEPLPPADPFHLQDNPFRLLWGTPGHLHSLVLETTGTLHNREITLPEGSIADETEIAFYCDCHPSVKIFVHDQKATTFQLGDPLKIITPTRELGLKFLLQEGEAHFFGHISRANRPEQIAAGRFETYDWKLSLRTIQRIGLCRIKFILTGI